MQKETTTIEKKQKRSTAPVWSAVRYVKGTEGDHT